MRIIEHLKGLRYTIDYAVEPYHLDFKVYKIAAWSPDGSGLMWECESGHPVPDLVAASTFLEGNVKYDGCMNADFTDLIHVCDLTGVDALRSVLGYLYHLASVHVPHWDDEVIPAPNLTLYTCP